MRETTDERTREFEEAIFAAELGGDAPSVDLHGMSGDEAADAVDAFLNHEFLEGTAVVRIVHGRGTGTLRDRVRTLLDAHPLVEYRRDAQAPGAVNGVTYAALARRA